MFKAGLFEAESSHGGMAKVEPGPRSFRSPRAWSGRQRSATADSNAEQRHRGCAGNSASKAKLQQGWIPSLDVPAEELSTALRLESCRKAEIVFIVVVQTMPVDVSNAGTISVPGPGGLSP